MGPLTPAVFHVLLALADRDRHGYGIMRDIAVRTSNRVLMGPGTLYGTLQRMLEAGLVEECGERVDSTVSDDRRRYYQITKKGRQAASQESERLQQLLRIARSKRLLSKTRVREELA